MNKNDLFLCVGPTTRNAVNAISEYSLKNKFNISLVATRNQIETASLGNGYVDKFNTDEFVKFIANKKNKYLSLSRDHCGPYIKSKSNSNLKEEIDISKKVIEDDIKNGFQFLHIDVAECPSKKKADVLNELIEFSSKIKKKLAKKTKLEIGHERHGYKSSYEQCKNFLNKINLSNVAFYALGTGSYVKENFQKGNFNYSECKKISNYLNKKNILIKDHNSDYLNIDSIYLRLMNGVGALNIQPNIAYVENSIILNMTKKFLTNRNYSQLMEEVNKEGSWEKWTNKENKELKFLLAGHYIQNTEIYKNTFGILKERYKIDKLIRDQIFLVLNKYKYTYDSLYTKRRTRN
jgi:tagatose-1,6-bisphosphate aldolase non-catalytic subunit AgaZ/GatZ